VAWWERLVVGLLAALGVLIVVAVAGGDVPVARAVGAAVALGGLGAVLVLLGWSGQRRGGYPERRAELLVGEVLLLVAVVAAAASVVST
jgi:hypothetical protein